MEEIIMQVAGMSKEVATSYIIIYGVLELSKLLLVGFLGYHAIKIVGGGIIKLLDF